MKPTLTLFVLSVLLTGCSIFRIPDKKIAAPVSPQTPAEKAQAWAADTVAQKRSAEREKFEKDLNKAIGADAAK